MKFRIDVRAGLVVGAVLLAACNPFKNPNAPSTTTVVTQTVVIGQPTPSPSPGPQGCGFDGIVLGATNDDFRMRADGTDAVTLVPSFYLGIAELPADCTKSLAPVYSAPSGSPAGPCVVSGNNVTSTTPGSCPLVARVGAVTSNPVTVTAVP